MHLPLVVTHSPLPPRAGIAMHPLIKQLQERLPEGSQGHFRSIVTDEFLRVRGAPGGTIFALGDAATIEQQKALAKADELFTLADVNGDNSLSLAELRRILRQASKEFPHLAGGLAQCFCMWV